LSVGNDGSFAISFNSVVDGASDLTQGIVPDDGVSILVTRAGTDTRAMAELIKSCRPYVARLCRRHGRSRADADDLEQEVWLALVKGVARINEPAAVFGWLRQVTIRAAIARSRKSGREVPSGATVVALDLDARADTTPEAVLRAEGRRAVRKAMERLDQNDRALLSLLSADDSPDYARISAEIGRPIGSIGPTRQRALDRLRRDRAVLALAD
jgi:RNA polymerase sigma factor (sigma-70 family)